MMQRRSWTCAIATSLVAFSFAAAAPALHAQSEYSTRGGRTTLTLSSELTTALSDLKVTVGTLDGTELAAGKADFALTSGAIDLSSGKLQFLHKGGLTFSTPGTTVELGNFLIDTTAAKATITGTVTVNGNFHGRDTLFDLTLPSGLTLPLMPADGMVDLMGITVTLDARTAAVLNQVYRFNAFQGGYLIGTAEVQAFVPWDAMAK